MEVEKFPGEQYDLTMRGMSRALTKFRDISDLLLLVHTSWYDIAIEVKNYYSDLNLTVIPLPEGFSTYGSNPDAWMLISVKDKKVVYCDGA